MGQPADISARLCFMFPGCLKRAGTLSDGHGTAKEEAPLTGERGGLLLRATIEEKRNKDRRRRLMCFTVFVQYNCPAGWEAWETSPLHAH